MARYKIAYVDEVQKDLDSYGSLLGSDDLTVHPFRPPPNLDVSAILGEQPDLILIDYELTKQDNDHEPATYQGGTLGTRLREAAPETPLILFTRRSLLAKYKGAVGQLGALDDTLYKDEVVSEPEQAKSLLRSFIEGYAALRGAPGREWSHLVEILGADPREAELLKAALPPLSPPPEDPSALKWSVPGAAKWILRPLLAYPGILSDSLHAATSLGISERSFLAAPVQQVLTGCAFEGPFRGLHRAWWKGKLHRAGFKLIAEAGLEPLLPTNLGAAIHRIHGIDVEANTCVFSGEPTADAVCFVLLRPVKRAYSLEYFPDNRPTIMDPARVSFKAIIEDTRVRDEWFSDEGRAMLLVIRRGVEAGKRGSTQPMSDG